MATANPAIVGVDNDGAAVAAAVAEPAAAVAAVAEPTAAAAAVATAAAAEPIAAAAYLPPLAAAGRALSAPGAGNILVLPTLAARLRAPPPVDEADPDEPLSPLGTSSKNERGTHSFASFVHDVRRIAGEDGFIPDGVGGVDFFEVVGPSVAQAERRAFEYACSRFRTEGLAFMQENADAAALPLGNDIYENGAVAPRSVVRRKLDLSFPVRPVKNKNVLYAQHGAALSAHLIKRMRELMAALFDVSSSSERQIACMHRYSASMPQDSRFSEEAIARGTLTTPGFFEPTEFVAHLGAVTWFVRISIDSVQALKPVQKPQGAKGAPATWIANYFQKPGEIGCMGPVRATVTADIVKATGFELATPVTDRMGLVETLFGRLNMFSAERPVPEGEHPDDVATAAGGGGGGGGDGGDGLAV